MWLQNWLYNSCLQLLKRHGTKPFTFRDAKEELAYSETATWKVLNELEKAGIVAKSRSKEDYRKRVYRLTLRLEEMPFHRLTVPTREAPSGRVFMDYMPTSHYRIETKEPIKEYYRRQSAKGKFLVTIEKGKNQSKEETIAEAIKRYDTEFVSKALQRMRVNWRRVLKRANAFRRRYVGALIDALIAKGTGGKKLERLRDQIYLWTKNDGRFFSVHPKKLRKQPKEFARIGKKWRVNMNISSEEVVIYGGEHV